MSIALQGQGTGLDIGGIVSSLVGAERAPKDARLNQSEARFTAEISAIGSLKSAITTFTDALEKLEDPETFLGNKVTLPNSDYFTAKADEDAVAGSYDITIDQLARSQKVGTTNVADITAPVGEGSLTFEVDGESFDIQVGADDSLQDVMKAINADDDNVGVTAAIINSDGGAKLVLTSNKTGTDNNVTVSASDSGGGTGLSDTFDMTELQAAENAIIQVDGLQITSQSNEVEGAITGITLDLKKADVDESITIKVEPDKEKAKKEVEEFVEAYNSLMSTIDGLTSFNADTNQSSIFQGDSMVRGIESQLRSSISSGFSTEDGELRLAEFGISTTRDGTLEIDDDKLDDALDNNLSDMSDFFAAEDTGFVADITAKMEVYTQTGGILDSRDESVDRQVSRIQDDRDALNLRMVSYEQRLTKQYNAMDAAVAELNGQLGQIQSALSSLPGFTRNQ
ncbi:flagellar filament capping protein FliD [Shewanella sp. 202IG2-18]|uniref:flagellar filament capping protein FliD n=1 Tax=Parashewanella hymeniacidonis TaxID=2807618 RepID=UPI001960066D|nr:flagellar filament capping protein FliD [Parashewanella hymeniacidonis]MBM7072211.1 flagellar filament capping protein FliD [Parashewanella hymeniacidonis]